MAGRAAGIVAILGAILLILSLFLVYYSWSVTSPTTGTRSEAFFLNNKAESGFSGTLVTQSYDDAKLSHVGMWYNIVTYLTYAGIVFGFLGAILAFMSRSGAARGLLALALIFALIGPMLLLAEQPSALTSDINSNSGTNPS